MSKVKVETTSAKKLIEKTELVFMYPTIGDGISIRAKNKAEADKQAVKIKEAITPPTPEPEATPEQ